MFLTALVFEALMRKELDPYIGEVGRNRGLEFNTVKKMVQDREH